MLFLIVFSILSFSKSNISTRESIKEDFYTRLNILNGKKFNVMPLSISFKENPEDQFYIRGLYKSNEKMSLVRSREVIVGISKKILFEGNTDITIRPFLRNFPLDISSLTVILVPNEGSKSEKEPFVTFVQLQNGVVRYELSSPKGIIMNLWETWVEAEKEAGMMNK